MQLKRPHRPMTCQNGNSAFAAGGIEEYEWLVKGCFLTLALAPV